MEFMIIITFNTPSLFKIKAMANQVCRQKTATGTEVTIQGMSGK
jgi:hypothetical protein